jgi:hypothetical protein
MNKWKEGRKEQMNKWMNKWMNEWMDEWMDGYMDGYMDGWMNGCRKEEINDTGWPGITTDWAKCSLILLINTYLLLP